MNMKLIDPGISDIKLKIHGKGYIDYQELSQLGRPRAYCTQPNKREV